MQLKPHGAFNAQGKLCLLKAASGVSKTPFFFFFFSLAGPCKSLFFNQKVTFGALWGTAVLSGYLPQISGAVVTVAEARVPPSR